jgi:ribosome maturation factor RimP
MAQGQGRGGGRRSGASRSGARDDTGRGRRAGTAPVRQRRPDNEAGPNRARLREVIEPVVAAAGYDVEGLSVSRAGRRHLIRLTVDRDGGVSLDAVAEVSRLVSAALDEVEAGGEELFAGEYELQVSSPGVDRPLTLPRHWRRNVGRLVQVRAGDRQLTGRVLTADDRGVVLAVGDPGQTTEHQLAYDGLGAGKVQLEFARAAALTDDDLEDIPVDDDLAPDSGRFTAGSAPLRPLAADHDDDFEEDEA